MDSDGAFRHFPQPGALRDQPAVDMEILRAIRSRWVQLKNAEIEARTGKPRNGKH